MDRPTDLRRITVSQGCADSIESQRPQAWLDHSIRHSQCSCEYCCPLLRRYSDKSGSVSSFLKERRLGIDVHRAKLSDFKFIKRISRGALGCSAMCPCENVASTLTLVLSTVHTTHRLLQYELTTLTVVRLCLPH